MLHESSINQLTHIGACDFFGTFYYLYLLNIIMDSGPSSNSVGPSGSNHCFLFDAHHNFGLFDSVVTLLDVFDGLHGILFLALVLLLCRINFSTRSPGSFWYKILESKKGSVEIAQWIHDLSIPLLQKHNNFTQNIEKQKAGSKMRNNFKGQKKNRI